MKDEKKGELMKVEISRRQRNNIFHHLQIPYYIGKNVNQFTIQLGKTTIEKSFEAGREVVTIGDILGQKIGKQVKALDVRVIKNEK